MLNRDAMENYRAMGLEAVQNGHEDIAHVIQRNEAVRRHFFMREFEEIKNLATTKLIDMYESMAHHPDWQKIMAETSKMELQFHAYDIAQFIRNRDWHNLAKLDEAVFMEERARVAQIENGTIPEDSLEGFIASSSELMPVDEPHYSIESPPQARQARLRRLGVRHSSSSEDYSVPLRGLRGVHRVNIMGTARI